MGGLVPFQGLRGAGVRRQVGQRHQTVCRRRAVPAGGQAPRLRGKGPEPGGAGDVLGVPNVGKSTFINRIAGRKTAKTEDRPGVTRAKQWVPIDRGLELLDTPGILWPKFEDQSVGLNLAYTGAVKDEILDMETLGCHLMAYLGTNYPEALRTGYKLPSLPERQDGEEDVAWGYRLLEAAGKKRGFLISGGEVDTERMAKILLDEYRAGKLGRFTLEMPEETEQPAASE